MTAPTEAEIRDMLDHNERVYIHDRVGDRVSEAVGQAFTVITYTALDPKDQEGYGTAALSSMWADLTANDLAELASIVEAAKSRAIERAHEAIRQEVVAAGLAFGADHPHATRIAREAVPA